MKSKFKYKLGDKWFRSKKEIIEFAWKFLKTHKGRITREGDDAFIRALLSTHARKDEKIGSGIDYFYVAKSPDHPNNCFYIMRVDGSYTDFGIGKCMDSFFRLNEALMREVIRYQIDAYKSRFIVQDSWTFTSEYSNEEFPVNKMHCDHIIPFKHICDKFAEMENLNLDKNLLSQSYDNVSNNVFEDIALMERWRAFHAKFPLRVVSSFENLSILKKKSNKLGKDYYTEEISSILGERKNLDQFMSEIL